MDTESAVINRLSEVGIMGNVLLSGFKLFAGIVGNSGAMISDAVHSLSDVGATAIAAIGSKAAHKELDHDHPYGHERFENVASVILGAILVVTGLMIGYEGMMKIITGDYGGRPEMIALAAAVISIVLKEAMYHYTMHYANILDSDSFRADAWHHRTDAMSSVAALIGIALALNGFPIMDPIASIVICLFILKIAYDILKDNFTKMVDTACDDEEVDEMRSRIMQVKGVRKVDVLNTRRFGNRIYVDVEISVDGQLSVAEGHRIAEDVHDMMKNEFCSVKDVMVHVNPS